MVDKEILETALQGTALKLAVKQEDSWARVGGLVTALIALLAALAGSCHRSVKASMSWVALGTSHSPAHALCGV